MAAGTHLWIQLTELLDDLRGLASQSRHHRLGIHYLSIQVDAAPVKNGGRQKGREQGWPPQAAEERFAGKKTGGGARHIHQHDGREDRAADHRDIEARLALAGQELDRQRRQQQKQPAEA